MNRAPRTALARDQHDIAPKRPTFEERDLRGLFCELQSNSPLVAPVFQANRFTFSTPTCQRITDSTTADNTGSLQKFR
jgi:hypothetical protein